MLVKEAPDRKYYWYIAVGAGGFHNEHCDKENQYVCKKQSGATQPIPPTTTKEPPENSYCPIGYTAIDPKHEPNMGKCTNYTWWRHEMEFFPRSWLFGGGNPPVIGGFSSQWPVTRSFDVFFELRLYERLRKQSRHPWFETLSRSAWHGGIVTKSLARR